MQTSYSEYDQIRDKTRCGDTNVPVNILTEWNCNRMLKHGGFIFCFSPVIFATVLHEKYVKVKYVKIISSILYKLNILCDTISVET